MTSPDVVFMLALMVLFGVALVIAATLERRRAREIRKGMRDVVTREGRLRRGTGTPREPGSGPPPS